MIEIITAGAILYFLNNKKSSTNETNNSSLDFSDMLKTSKYDTLINKYGSKYNVSFNLIKSIIATESSFNPNARLYNPKLKSNGKITEDSRGLGQINYNTANAFGIFELDSLYIPDVNIETICKVIVDIRKRYSSLTDIIASYNAGKVYKKDDGTYTNQTYVNKVMKNYKLYGGTNYLSTY